MVRGCVASLLLLVGIIVGYYIWFDQVFDPPLTYFAAGVVGFVVFCCIGAIRTGFHTRKEVASISAARWGKPMVHGATVVASGKIFPVGQSLQAPFSGTDCVMCEYSITKRSYSGRDRRDTNTQGDDYTGFLMTPCVIRTTNGDVRLLGFPQLDDAFKKILQSPDAVARAKTFVQQTEFQDCTGMKLVSLFSVIKDVWCDDDGLVSKNVQITNIDIDELFPPELNEMDEDYEEVEYEEEMSHEGRAKLIPRLIEKCVPAGTDVCVIGVYDEMKTGLVPPSLGSTPNRLLFGTAAEVERRLQSKIKSHIIGGLFVLMLLHSGVLAAMNYFAQIPSVMRDRQQRAEQAASKGDIDQLAPLVRRGLDINHRDAEDRTLLMRTTDPAMSAWLLSQGIDANAVDNDGESVLILAARFRRLEILRQLIEANVDLNLRSGKTNLTALGEAEASNHTEVAEMLRKAGAKK